jgi:hypothetical protein
LKSPGVVVPPGCAPEPASGLADEHDRRKTVYFNFDWDYGEFLSDVRTTSARGQPSAGRQPEHGVPLIRNDIDFPEGPSRPTRTLRATYNSSTSLFAQTLIRAQTTDEPPIHQPAVHLIRRPPPTFTSTTTQRLQRLPVNRSFIVTSHQIDLLR